MADIVKSKKQQLAECEEIIQRGIGTFVEVGTALKRIKDGKLYKKDENDKTTFAEYCEVRFGMAKTHAYRQIQAKEVAELLSVPHGGKYLTHERIAREFVPLLDDPQKCEAAYAEAVDTVPTRDGEERFTAMHARDVVKRYLLPPTEDTVPDTGTGYKCIVIDPPWPMEKIVSEARPKQRGFSYPTMTLEDIQAFSVPDMAGDECHLFMWTTQKFLPAAFDVLDAWGFTYLVTMVWHKSGGFQPFGLPQYNCEFVILARKGGLKFESTKAFPCCFNGKRREHSRKPDEFYDIVRRVSPERRIDVFSRGKHDGFDQYGNETEKFTGDDIRNEPKMVG